MGDVRAQHAVHAAALVTEKHASVNRSPRRVCDGIQRVAMP